MNTKTETKTEPVKKEEQFFDLSQIKFKAKEPKINYTEIITRLKSGKVYLSGKTKNSTYNISKYLRTQMNYTTKVFETTDGKFGLMPITTEIQKQ